MIGERELIAAAWGHIEAFTPTDVDAVHLKLVQLGVDPDAIGRCLATLKLLRVESVWPAMSHGEMKAYSGGLLDGFVIGVRAAREESRAREDHGS